MLTLIRELSVPGYIFIYSEVHKDDMLGVK